MASTLIDVKYTITYNGQGGTGTPSTTTGWERQIPYGGTFTVWLSGTSPTKTGYNFLGWSESMGATTATYQPSDSVTFTANGTAVSMALYAVWSVKTYTVSYNKGSNGTGTNTTATKTHDVDLTLKNAIFTRTNYTQDGWSSSDGGSKSYNLGGTYSANAAITLYPHWVANTYSISYNANSGSGAPSATTGSYNGTAGNSISVTLSSTNPTRTGYNFLGWSENSGATAADYSAGGSYSFTIPNGGGAVTKTLYAVWKLKTYTVSYNKGTNGTGTNTTATKTHGVALTLKNAIFTRTGYTQSAWATSDGGSQAYALGASYTTNAAVTLYPVWSATTSTVSASNGTLGTAQTLTVTRNDNSFTHTITYAYGSATGTIVTKSSNTSISWTPPLSLASQFPSATSGTCTLTVTTYSGNTSLGTTTKTITLSIPTSVKVTISSVSLQEATSGLASKFGAYIQGYSKIKITTNTSTSNAYGATLVSVSPVTLSGNSTTQTLSGSPVTSAVVQSSGTVNYSSKIKDTRGRTATSSGTVTVLAYSSPTASISSVSRASNGADIAVKYTWAITALDNKNDKSVSIKYKLRTVSSWTTATTITPSEYSGNITYTITGTSASSAYDVRVDVTDYFSTASVTKSIASSGNRFFDCSATDGTIAFHGDNPNNGDGYDKWLEKPVRFYEVPDISKRRADASLSSAGWYNIIKFNIGSSIGVKFATAQILNIRMGTTYSNTSNCVHEVTMLATYNTNPRFADELSRSNVNVIDKIRYRYDANNNGWIDVHYSATASNNVWMTFDVGSYNTTQKYWISQNFVPVDDAPATGGTADTILTTHDFLATTGGSISFTPTTGSAYSSYGNCYYAKDGNVVQVHIGMQGLTASTSTNIFTLPADFRPKTTVVATGNGSGIATLARARVLSDGTIQVYSSATTALIDVIFICSL